MIMNKLICIKIDWWEENWWIEISHKIGVNDMKKLEYLTVNELAQEFLCILLEIINWKPKDYFKYIWQDFDFDVESSIHTIH